MRSNFTQLYLHLVWATMERMPLLTPELRPRVYAVIQRQISTLNSEVVAIGGMEDHVHVLLRFPTTVTVSTLAGRIKGASSHFVTQVLGRHDLFRWQGGYGAFTISKTGVARVRDYILNQEERHRIGNVIPELEGCDP